MQADSISLHALKFSQAPVQLSLPVTFVPASSVGLLAWLLASSVVNSHVHQASDGASSSLNRAFSLANLFLNLVCSQPTLISHRLCHGYCHPSALPPCMYTYIGLLHCLVNFRFQLQEPWLRIMNSAMPSLQSAWLMALVCGTFEL